MFFKNWPYWLKGGIIIGMICVIYFFIIYGYEINFACGSKVTCGIGTAVLNLPSLLVVSFLINLGFFSIIGRIFGTDISKAVSIAAVPIMNFIIGFILGSLMGWIYGKIRNIIKK